MKILTLGPSGTYSGLAAKKYLKDHNIDAHIIFYPTFYDVVVNLEHDDIAILPFENQLDGYIQSTLDLLYDHNLTIINNFSIDVAYKLITNVDIENVEKTFVQFSTINQVSYFLHEHNLKNIVVTESNILSLDYFLNNSNSAAVIPSHVETNTIYTFDNIGNFKNNHTRFIVIKKDDPLKIDNYHHLSLFVIFNDDKSGMLYDMLFHFKKYDININAILSRPSKKKLGSYYFFLEIDVHNINNYELENILNNLKTNYDLKISGLY